MAICGTVQWVMVPVSSLWLDSGVAQAPWSHEPLWTRHHEGGLWFHNGEGCSHDMGWVSWSTRSGHWLVTTMMNCFGPLAALHGLHTPTMMGYSSTIMHYVIGPKLSRIGLSSILESLHYCCGHFVGLIWTPSSIFEMWWRGSFTPKIMHLELRGSCGWLSRLNGSRVESMLWCVSSEFKIGSQSIFKQEPSIIMSLISEGTVTYRSVYKSYQGCQASTFGPLSWAMKKFWV